MAIQFLNNKIKSYAIRVSRDRIYLRDIIPTAKFKLQFNIVQTYDSVNFDDDYHRHSKGTTLINHNLERVVDVYDTLEEAETNLVHWQMNVGTEDLNPDVKVRI